MVIGGGGQILSTRTSPLTVVKFGQKNPAVVEYHAVDTHPASGKTNSNVFLAEIWQGPDHAVQNCGGNRNTRSVLGLGRYCVAYLARGNLHARTGDFEDDGLV